MEHHKSKHNISTVNHQNHLTVKIYRYNDAENKKTAFLENERVAETAKSATQNAVLKSFQIMRDDYVTIWKKLCDVFLLLMYFPQCVSAEFISHQCSK